MVPSRYATEDELIALCKVVSRFPGTTLEFIPCVGQFEDYAADLMTRMSLAADRPLNWNVLFVSAANKDMAEHNLAASDYATRTRRQGPRPDDARRAVAPHLLRQRLPARHDPRLAEADDAPPRREEGDARESRKAAPRSWRRRARARDWSASRTGRSTSSTRRSRPENKQFEGRSVGDIAKEQGKRPLDALLDIVVADDLMTGFGFPRGPEKDEDWQTRVQIWRDARTVVGASDAGAHLDFLATFNYSTALLGKAVRERQMLPIEEAIHMLTDVPARLYGITERGRIETGWHADIVVLDPTTIGPQPVRMRFDLPTNAPRLFGGADGIDHVLVNGAEIVDHGEFTDARPGRLFRSGRDTETVTAS